MLAVCYGLMSAIEAVRGSSVQVVIDPAPAVATPAVELNRQIALEVAGNLHQCLEEVEVCRGRLVQLLRGVEEGPLAASVSELAAAMEQAHARSKELAANALPAQPIPGCCGYMISRVTDLEWIQENFPGQLTGAIGMGVANMTLLRRETNKKHRIIGVTSASSATVSFVLFLVGRAMLGIGNETFAHWIGQRLLVVSHVLLGVGYGLIVANSVPFC